jgi:alpha-ketoglutarate-dependent taurine dioxygenase
MAALRLFSSALRRCFSGSARAGAGASAFAAAAAPAASVASVALPSPGLVAVAFAGGGTALFHGAWLRDHCPSAVHALTGQRTVTALDLPPHLAPAAAERCGGGARVRLQWPGGHASTFSAAWLRRYAYWWAEGAAPAQAQLLPPPPPPPPGDAEEALTVAAWWRDAARDASARAPWRAATFAAGAAALPAVPYSDFMGGQAGLRAALRLLRDVGFVVVAGVPATEDATRDACLRIGFLRPTLYGPGMWRTEVRPPEGGGVTDTAFTAAPLPLHTDGNYLGEAPGLQVFHCTRPDARGGGDSLLLDGLALAEAVAARDAAAFELLTLWPLPYHHTGSDGIVGAARPVFALDGEGRVESVHYNSADRGPVMLPPSWARELALARALVGGGAGGRALAPRPALASPATAIPALYAALAVLEQCLAEPALTLTLPLRPGMMLVFDNTRVLHGRAGFDVASGRTLVGCYMGRDEWSSRLRQLELEKEG